MKDRGESESGSSCQYETISNTSTPRLRSLKCYSRSRQKTVLFVLVCVFTFGIFFLASKWYLKLKAWALLKECPVRDAEVVIVQLTDTVCVETATRKVRVSEKSLSRGESSTPVEVLLCDIQHETFILNEDIDTFEPLVFPMNLTYQQIHLKFGEGIANDDIVAQRTELFGQCVIDVPVPTFFQVFWQEVMHPFFVFQLVSMLIWTTEDYYAYAGIILFMSMVSICLVVMNARSNFRKIREMAYYETNVKILSGKPQRYTEESSMSTKLVPGMLISVPFEWTAPCDMVLLSGNCVMNEGLLTGESMPMLKDPLPKMSEQPFNKETDEKHLIFAGTRCIQVRGNPVGLVISTGFSTAKGEIVRSILFSKPARMDFGQDSMSFVGILACIASATFILAAIVMLAYDESGRSIIIKTFDLVTISIPPGLPMALSIGITFAMHRLKYANIVCIAPSSINSAGRVSVVCCDKTGTLTEDCMKFHGAISATESSFDKFTRAKATLPPALLCTLSSCQSLTVINGQLVGDPQESSLHRELELQFEEEDGRRIILMPDRRLEVVQMFYFSSALRRMGVVAVDSTTGLPTLYMKGAPETMRKLCKSVPDNFSEVVFQHSRQGLRILACAHKALPDYSPADTLAKVEDGLTLDGLVMFHNQLMAETPYVVSTLQFAGYQIVIATGDNTLTGLSVAYDCGIVPKMHDSYIADFNSRSGKLRWEKHSGDATKELPEGELEWMERMRSGDTEFAIALNGRTFTAIATLEEFSSILPAVLKQLRVCGRMSPNQKSLLVEKFQDSANIVAMCGDGANDCGALKSADVGLSVSYEESSVAAPFTARSLLSIIELFREGKAALATSLHCFKFMAMYAMIQVMTATILYCMDTNMSNRMYLFIDIAIVVPLTYVIGDTQAYSHLTPDQLPRKLLSAPILTSFFGQTVVQTLFLVLAYLLELTQDWYSYDGDGIFDPTPGNENTALFLVSLFQYIAVCCCYSIGPPFRFPAYTNLQLMLVMVALCLLNLYLLLFPMEWTRDLLDMGYLPTSFRLVLLSLIVGNVAATFLFEIFMVKYISERWTAAHDSPLQKDVST